MKTAFLFLALAMVTSAQASMQVAGKTWCDSYWTSEMGPEQKVMEKSTYNMDSTYVINHYKMSEETVGDLILSTTMKWKSEGDRIVLEGSMGGQTLTLSYVPLFRTENGKSCYELTDVYHNGTKILAGENAAPSLKCECN